MSLVKIFRILLLAYLLVLMAVYLLQRRFMYFPPQDHSGLFGTSLSQMEEVSITSASGDQTIVWWAPPKGNKPVIIYFHGNGSSVYDGRFIYQSFLEKGYGVLGAEYPGYPYATGRPSQKSIVSAALAQYDFVIDQGITPNRIYLYGTSLGAGVAAQVADKRTVGRLVLEAPFNSMLNMVQIRMPLFAFPFLVKDKYQSHKALDGKNIPLLWIHGTNDGVIPMSQGQKLFDGYAGPKQKIIIEDGDHNDLWVSGGREVILDFFNE